MSNKEETIASVADAEVRILEVLWREAPLGSQEIIDRLGKDNGSKPQTIKTLINRLLTKGAIGYREEGRKYLYHPVISQTDFYRLKTERFLDRFYGGRLTPLVSFFSRHKQLSEQDIAELKALIAKMESGDEN